MSERRNVDLKTYINAGLCLTLLCPAGVLQTTAGLLTAGLCLKVQPADVVKTERNLTVGGLEAAKLRLN